MNQNIFCSKCHRIPSQCCCSSANELADKLENNITSWGDCTHEQHDNDKYFKEQAATMLRQQATEIEQLKKHGYAELTEDEIKEVYDQYFDVENFGWLHLQCILEILQRAREK